MTTLADLHPIYREALCVWEAFRRAGFAAGEIYVGRFPPEGCVVVALPHLKYGWVVTPSGHDPLELATVDAEDFVRGWKAAANLWNELAARQDPELQLIWEVSDVQHRSVEFVSLMMDRSIELPCTADC